jgi:hypothetical protein
MHGLAAMPTTDGRTGGQTDRIPEFNTSFIVRGKKPRGFDI